jgi:L,D-transpeptidase ErfK/SrfK
MRILIRFTVLVALFAVFLAMNGDSLAARGWLLQTLCDDVRLYCITIRKGETWQSLFPEPGRRDTVMRINRMNTRLWPGMRIAIPRDPSSTNAMDYTPFSPYRIPSGKKMVVYSPALNAWAAYGPAGNIIRWGPASSGQNWCPDLGHPCHTPSGNFKIYEKRGIGCISTKFPKPYGGAPMPYCMFFKGGFAMHGSNGVPGYNASHGCVRMFIEDAEWLNRGFAEIGTQLIILPYPLNQYAQREDADDDNDNDSEDDGSDDIFDINQTDSG